MYRYANLDKNNVVFAISILHSEKTAEGLILTNDLRVVEGFIYNPETQTFSPPEPQPNPESKASIEEVAEETLLETKYQTFLLEMMI